MKLKQGQSAPTLDLKTIHGKDVHIPDLRGFTIHLQFRRFAGCPICNLHLQSFRQQIAEIEIAGVREVVVFHSSDSELLPYQGQFPFAVIGDPKRVLYRLYGVENSLLQFLNPAAWLASFKGTFAKDKPKLSGYPNGGVLGLPADFLIAPDGVIAAAHYGKHAYDQWSVDEVLELSFAVR
jgi:peroxiredoxin